MAIYMKVDGVDGESKDSKHEKWIQVQSFNIGVTQQGAMSHKSAPGPISSQADFSDFSVNREIDASNPELWLNCAKGHEYAKVMVDVVAAAGDAHAYLRYEFEGVIVSAITITASASGRPMESISFNYRKLKWAYTPWEGNTKGTEVSRGWDLMAKKQK